MDCRHLPMTVFSAPRSGRLLAAALALCLVVPAARPGIAGATVACEEAAHCDALFALPDGLTIPLYANYSLQGANPAISRAVIVVHGNGRNPESYFKTLIRALKRAGRRTDTLAIVPYFSLADDRFNREDNEVYWDRSRGWKRGDRSTRDLEKRIGSFAVLDAVLDHLADADAFANLEAVVIAGHSAGGQFVQRYAAGQPPNPAPNRLRLRYVVANPSSYLYFNRHRPAPGFAGGFAPPAPDERCRYNRYKYGMEKRNAYMARTDAATLIARYRSRQVIYLLGARDTDADARSLDKRCQAMAQGRHRHERGRIFKAYMDRFFSPHSHQLVVVPGVGHSARRMFTSPEGLAALFD
jgi:pimeloyl-ACP methyl ester carboxylesterase